MKIFIQARKDGYNVLYPKPTPQEFFNFGSDIQRIDAQTQSCYYGKEFYSLAFSSTGRIFSKYVIGYDVQRGAVGYIAFSIFIPKDKMLSGKDVKSLLDTLAGTYIQNYSPNFYFDNKKNEDWNQFADIANGFDSNLKRLSDEDVESVAPGSETPAFLFYRTDEELSRYLDDHYQSEYYPYQQVYFVDKKYEGQKDNPLSIVKINPQANLTGRIDLDNPKYRIEFENGITQNGNRIKVEVNNGVYWKQLFNKNKFRRKDVIRISWTKDCYEQKILTGTLVELSDSEGIHIDNGTVHITGVELTPVKKSIKIIVNDPNGQSISKPAIVCCNSDKERKFNENGIITFVREDIRRQWIISVNSGNMSGTTRIIPGNLSDCLSITVHEKKSIKVSVIDADTSEPISDFEVWTKRRGGFSKDKTIIFIDDEIDQEARISVKCKGYKQEDFKFNPREYDDNVTLELSRKEDTIGGKQPGIAFWLKSHLKIIASICCVLVFGILACIILHCFTSKTPTKNNLWPRERVEKYLQGDSLIMVQIDTCKKSLEESRPKSKSWSPFFWKKNNGNDNDLEEYIKNKDIAKNIKTLRESIDKNNWIEFANCNDSLFSGNSSLQALKSIVNAAGKNMLEQINVPGINNLPLCDIRKKVEGQIDSLNKKQPGNRDTNVTEDICTPTVNPPTTNPNKSEGNRRTEKEQEIITYLENGDWKKKKLEDYLKNATGDIKENIALALKLWDLDGKKPKTYYSYKNEIEKNTCLKRNSTLKKLLEEQNNCEKPKYIKDIMGSDVKSLSALREKANESN